MIGLVLVGLGMINSVAYFKDVEAFTIIGMVATVFVSLCAVILIWSPEVKQKGQTWSIIGAVAAFTAGRRIILGISLISYFTDFDFDETV